MPKFELIQGGKEPEETIGNDTAKRQERLKKVHALLENDPDRTAYLEKFLRLPEGQRTVVAVYGNDTTGLKRFIDSSLRSLDSERED